MTDLLKILKAKSPITLSGVPAGFQPWLLADIARAAPGRAMFVAPDEQLMRAVADTAHYFAPEIETVCLMTGQVLRCVRLLRGWRGFMRFKASRRGRSLS
jgi:transcription-repair coupling factor (superfamily II helicase)